MSIWSWKDFPYFATAESSYALSGIELSNWAELRYAILRLDCAKTILPANNAHDRNRIIFFIVCGLFVGD
jgi:hypothetical protein